jgi:uncharacterized protein
MSGPREMAPWSKPLEVDRLAETQAEVDFAIALAELRGLGSLRGGVSGQVKGLARFAREQGAAVVYLSLEGSATLQCQRCMQPMQVPLHATTRVALIGSEADAQSVPADFEPVLALGGRISIGELVTEELLLSLPIVPLHEDGAACTSAPPPDPAGGETHRPFARLGELMKR